MRLPLLLLAASGLIAGAASADECVPSTFDPYVTLDGSPVGGPTLYAHEDCFGSPICGGLFSLWIYEESNGIAGLQRGDEVVDNTCNGAIASDTIIL